MRIFVGETTEPPQKKPMSSLVLVVPFVSSYQSWAIQGAEEMVVVPPPMIFGETAEPMLDAFVVVALLSTTATASATRCFSVACDGALTDGLTVGVGWVAALAEVEISAAVTAAAIPAAATGSANRIRRLCRPLPDVGVPT